MEVETICSKCKESIGLLESVQTQTVEADWTDEDVTDNFELDNREESEQDYGTDERTCKKDTIRLEDITFIEQSEGSDAQRNTESVEYAVYQDVSDEAFDMDSAMELGTFAEMCHSNDKIVALTRSFEYISHVKRRWQLGANVGRATSRFNRLRKGNEPQVNESEDMLSESEDSSGLSGCRRIVISNGRIPISRQDVGAAVNDDGFREAAEEGCAIFGVHNKMESICEDLLREEKDHESNLRETMAIHEEGQISKDKVNQASQVLGPNKRCLQLHEQEEEVGPEHDISLFDTDKTMYNVVVVTRSFECGALTDSERAARQNWNRLKNATKLSKALDRFKPSSHQRESDKGQSLFGNDENIPFVGSGYRRMNMKTIEQVANLARKKNLFWKLRR